MTDLFTRIGKSIGRRRAQVQNNRRITRMAGEVAHHEPVTKSSPVVFFNASTRLEGLSLNAAYSLLAGWSLRLSGTAVVHFACHAGVSRCVLGTQRDHPDTPPPCRTCIKQSQTVYSDSTVHWFNNQSFPILVKVLANLGLNDLIGYEYQGMPLGTLALPSLRWILRRHHLTDNEGTRFLLRQYILSAWQVGQEFASLLNKVQPSAVVVFNGMFYPEATARWVAQKRGVRVITHEVGLQPFSGFFTPGEATAYPIDIPKDFKLSAEQNERLDSYLTRRFQGNFSMAGIRFWPQIDSLSPAFWERVKPFRQIVPVFTNVIFDTSQGHANVVFPHMFAWLDLVLEIIRGHPETYFVIRAHPDECRPGKESSESVADWAKKNGVAELPNALFVNANEYFSSYELIQRSKFVMVYNSTIGMEATLLGMPVLCGGKARFTQLPMVFFPRSPESFREQAETFLAADHISTPPEFIQNARYFLYYQIFKTSLPFDKFLDEDPFWKGYATLKIFPWQALLPENSPSIKAVVEGINGKGSFLLEG
jgi:hypothetical protein